MSEHVPSFFVLAAGGSGSPLLIVIGVIIVGALLAAFWIGSRRTARKPKPPRGPQPRSGSWDTPDSPTEPPHRH
ncbi:DUF6479 family protein [Streptomyces uncialis]|uniref:DUF6479 family protein n=1 Tax=Streptomyces uncialis TaxID=1048205 RepID=UPI0022590638|nr:DUF6479 family protein [Streptomyces uncialis]MCX4658423.1 DUF6479 family protein [Streptomyces uncialis]WTE14676.1 DUF6479 family protein [Streptomyces uncialis]